MWERGGGGKKGKVWGLEKKKAVIGGDYVLSWVYYEYHVILMNKRNEQRDTG